MLHLTVATVHINWLPWGTDNLGLVRNIWLTRTVRFIHRADA